MLKTCLACNKEKLVEDFHKHRGRKDGRNDVCKECANRRVSLYAKTPGARAVRKKFWEQYKEKEENRDKLQAYHRKYNGDPTPEQKKANLAARKRRKLASPRSRLYGAIYSAAKRHPTENIITIDELMEMFAKQQGLCAISGVKMTWGDGEKNGKKSPVSLSIDRIDGSRGYEPENVRLVCWQVNLFKNEWSDTQMFSMAQAIVAQADAKYAKAA
jgi:hypothetical protein